MPGLFKRWADDYVRHLHGNHTTSTRPEDYAQQEETRLREERAQWEKDQEPDHAEEELADATPREEKTVGQLTLDDRGTIVEVKATGLTARGLLQDFHGEGFTEWEAAYTAPHILSGPITLELIGFRDYTAATVTCWPTDPITLIRRSTP